MALALRCTVTASVNATLCILATHGRLEAHLNLLCIEIETIAKIVAQRGGGLVELVEKQKHNDQFQGNVLFCQNVRERGGLKLGRYGALSDSYHPAQAERGRLARRD